MARRLLLLLLTVLVPALAGQASAGAAALPVCGSVDRQGNPVRGTLSLDDLSSTTKSYRSDEGRHDLALLYAVQGCVLPGTVDARAVTRGVTLLPATSGADLPGGAAVRLAVVSADPSSVAVRVRLDLARIDPGARGGVVRVHLPRYLADAMTPVAVRRTAGAGLPLLLGLLGALGGLAWVIGLHVADAAPGVRFTWKEATVLTGLVLGAGVVAGYAYWSNQDVWTGGENGFATLTAGFAASTTGALAGVTAALFRS